MLFNLFNQINICIFSVPLHIYDMNNHYCIFHCSGPHWGWPKETKHVGGLPYVSIFLYLIIVQ